MKSKITALKNHVIKHRFKYGVVTGLTAGGYLVYRASAEWTEFAEEHGVIDAWNDHLNVG
jgi:hypothetical protein